MQNVRQRDLCVQDLHFGWKSFYFFVHGFNIEIFRIFLQNSDSDWCQTMKVLTNIWCRIDKSHLRFCFRFIQFHIVRRLIDLRHIRIIFFSNWKLTNPTVQLCICPAPFAGCQIEAHVDYSISLAITITGFWSDILEFKYFSFLHMSKWAWCWCIVARYFSHFIHTKINRNRKKFILFVCLAHTGAF